jgi:DNA polymerase III sliding clamp (beta) subunit (PCNA family)
MYTLTVSLATLRAARTHAAEKDVRYYLQGVYLDTAAGKVVATDGHRLFAANARGVKSNYPAVIVPNETIDAALKQFTGEYARGKSLGAVEVAITIGERDLVTITTPSGEVKGRTLDGRFPEWRRVVPKAEDVGDQVPAVLNTQYLTDACEALSIARNLSKKAASQHAIRIHMRGEFPTVVTDNTIGVLALVMPMRNDLSADVARMACRMAHDDALAYSAETAADVAAEAA